MIRIRYHAAALLLATMTASLIVVDADLSWAQSAPASPRHSQADLLNLPQPDLAGIDPPARKQIQSAQAALEAAIAQPVVARIQQAKVVGSLGQIYQAYGFDDAALACYTNAARLDSRSFRWTYYQGYLHQKSGDVELAVRDYQRALTIDPDNGPALVRLGMLQLTLDRPDAARQYFTKAMAQRNSPAAAYAGLGKVAFIERQYSLAIRSFNQALARDPKASSIHYQLAMAYRGLGDLAHMQEQLQARGNVDPTIKDSLLDEIDALKQGTFSLLERGGAAMRDSHFTQAVDIYRRLVTLDPSDPLAYKYLGMALAQSGQRGEALKQYARALQLDPANPAVHYNIGVLLIQDHNEEQAIAQFQKALQLDPGLTAAHFQLANLFMRKGRDADAEREYGMVISLEPQNGFARLMQAMAALHSGAYNRARTLLDQAALALPHDADIANALARVLAAAPDPAVRDQSRALRIVQSLVSNQQGDPLEVGITLAMALAAAGRFHEAAACQQAIIAQLEARRQYDLARLLRRNLVRYQQGQTCRVPWASDDPIFTPVPSTAQLSMEPKTMAAGP